ncbi:acylneuraminate cytidylyltransferase family protein [Magnetospirillum sp. 15-1]|uniref:acylneuraminate cytidylyltransferase family protein n=1 Tax=Magnetospirillum sp. 15-1 TaxID=1979370 RepID=UPI001482E278|nr:acylneuraminate cytidylyltransferase family protein [Magnetospirillum sp. 15-1]
MVNLLAIIPARGGSKGVPRKNIRMVGGKPLLAWSIEAARASRAVSRVVVSTDDAEIAEIARQYGAEVLMRPAGLAADDSPTLAVLRHVTAHLAEAEGWRADAILTLQPTSPLRTARHIDEAWALFAADATADSLVSCIAVPHIFHPRSVMRRNRDGYLEPYLADLQPTRRQDKEAVFARNGAALYITRADRLDSYVFGGRLLCYMMEEADSVDIDTEDDLRRADALLNARAAAP